MNESKLYTNAKRATVKEARDLRVGDIIECYYADDENPVHELVVQTTYSSKEGTYTDIRVMRIDGFGSRSGYRRGPFWLNTDKFKLLLSGKDVAEVLEWIPAVKRGGRAIDVAPEPAQT